MAQRALVAVAVFPLLMIALVAGTQAIRPALDVERIDLPTLTLAALLAVVGAATLATGVRGRRPTERPTEGRLATIGIVVGGILVTVIAMGITLADVEPPRVVDQAAGGSGGTITGHPDPSGLDGVGLENLRPSSVAIVLLAAALVAALVLGVWWLRRDVVRRDVVVTRRVVDRAVAAARRAVGQPSQDARGAILAAFAAFEGSMTTAVGPRAVGETQDEFVARILYAHDVDQSALDTLARCYRTARWSAATVTEADRADAVAALDGLGASR